VLDDRKLTVLRAIVEDYVSTTEPVGSKSLVDRHHFDVSPATIRNDMAVLEEQGFIAQPHTSAGRIPTDKGYRLFVDRLSSVKPLSAAERRAIETFLAGAGEEIEVKVNNVSIEDLRSSPYRATVDFEKIYHSPAAHEEARREKYVANIVFVKKDRVPNEMIPVNPLGLTITYFREDQAFR